MKDLIKIDMKKINVFKTIFYTCFCIAMLAACKKKDYYLDGGLAMQSEEEKAMTMYDFLNSRTKGNFDSLIKIIDMTGTKALVNQPGITFFPPINEGVILFQNEYRQKPSDPKQRNRPLSKMNIDSLKYMLNRFIIPGAKITLEQAYADGRKYYKDNNGDSLMITGVREDYNNGGVTAIGQGRMKIVYEHRRTIKDSKNDTLQMKTHNLITANGIIHVLDKGGNFHTKMIIKK